MVIPVGVWLCGVTARGIWQGHDRGEVSERLKELASKASRGLTAPRGFESHPLRHGRAKAFPKIMGLDHVQEEKRIYID